MESLDPKLDDKKKKCVELIDSYSDIELKSLSYISDAEELIEYLRSENAMLCEQVNNLKTEVDSVRDANNKDQELKFLNYVSDSEELIEYLRSENVKLCEQLNNLKTEADSVRSTNNEQCVEYQNCFMQERQKNKAVSEEVERLPKLHQEAISSCSKDGKNDNVLLNTPEGAQTTSGKESNFSAKVITKKQRIRRKPKLNIKQRRRAAVEREGRNMTSDNGHDDAIAVESSEYSIKETAPAETATDQLPECCKRTADTSDKALPEEVERLQKLHQEAISSGSKDGKNDNVLLRKRRIRRKPRLNMKRRRRAAAKREGMNLVDDSGQDDAIAVESSEYSIKETAPAETATDQLLECCKRTADTSDKALPEEVERLQKLHQEAISSGSKDGKNDNVLLRKRRIRRKPRLNMKQRRRAAAKRKGMNLVDDSGQDDAIAV